MPRSEENLHQLVLSIPMGLGPQTRAGLVAITFTHWPMLLALLFLFLDTVNVSVYFMIRNLHYFRSNLLHN